jgi:16S rRNA (cytosine967-C5)-methyltransferase
LTRAFRDPFVTEVTPARWSALGALRAMRRGELLDRAFASVQEQVPTRDRGWTQELVYGTVRLRGRIDYFLDRLTRRGIESLHPDVLDVLRLGAYQLLEMTSVPAYAAVSQSVEMTKAIARGAAGMVNGVLQSLHREQETIAFPEFASEPLEHLATWGSHPAWLLERWLRAFGVDETRALVEANNTRPELFIRPIRIDVEEAERRLSQCDIAAAPVALAPDALRLGDGAAAAAALACVPAVVQDPAAGLVVRYAAAPAGARIVDLCAAPGAKAIELAERAQHVVAADLSETRMQRLRENVLRIGALPLSIVVADARRPPVRDADLLLIDAPCTGTGTLRRHPDGRWRIMPVDLAALRVLQRQILDAAAPCVRAGGHIVYSTCSLEAEENEAQVLGFIASHEEFEIDPARDAVSRELLDDNGFLRVLPQHSGFDGAFAARLRKLV